MSLEPIHTCPYCQWSRFLHDFFFVMQPFHTWKEGGGGGIRRSQLTDSPLPLYFSNEIVLKKMEFLHLWNEPFIFWWMSGLFCHSTEYLLLPISRKVREDFHVKTSLLPISWISSIKEKRFFLSMTKKIDLTENGKIIFSEMDRMPFFFKTENSSNL